MIEIRTKTRSPVQIIMRSRIEVPGSGSRAFTTKVIPGLGSGKNVYLCEDERYTTYIDRLVKDGLISTRHVPNN